MADNAESELPVASIDFDVGSSALLGAYSEGNEALSDKLDQSNDVAPRVNTASKFDPVAQLMESDIDSSDNDDDVDATDTKPPTRIFKSIDEDAANTIEPDHMDSGIDVLDNRVEPEAELKKKRRPLNASRFVLSKGKGADSVVGRMARRSRAVTDDSSASDSDESVASTKPKRRATALNSNSDSDSDTGDATHDSIAANDTPPVTAPAPRAASKTALARIHQESERLIRETSVKLDPLEFTQRLHLSDFWLKFDAHVVQPRASPRKPFKMPPLQITGSFAFMSGDEQIMVVDDCDIDAFKSTIGSKLVPTHSVREVVHGQTALDEILSYGSQSMHTEHPHGVRRTDGPLALRDLNSALLDVMHKKDAEARAAQADKAAKRLKDKLERSQPVEPLQPQTEDATDEAVLDGDDELIDADDLLKTASAEDTDGEYETELDEEDYADTDGEDMDTKMETGQTARGKGRAAVSSDEDSEDEAAEKPAAATKSNFVSMFRMPVREVALQPGRMAKAPEPSQSAGKPTTPSQHISSQIPELPDLPDLLSSQIGGINTQDSLLMTPDPVSQRNRGALMGDYDDDGLNALALGTQPTQLMSVEGGEMTQSTQPTQLDLLSDQPTPLTVPTQLTIPTAEAGSETSILPTMVRNALDSDPAQCGSDDDETEAKSSASLQEPSLPAKPIEPAEHVEPADHADKQKRGRLLRRKPAAREHAKARRPKRSEFVEAEAEEGSSSEEDGAEKVKHRKFNWGSNAADARSDSEDDWDMDSEEEEAALMADPMIDNEEREEDVEGDRAIRELHRKQDFDQDEHDIQELFKDVTTGGLRSRPRTRFSLADDEDYNDRQTRAERMEERLRMRRKLQAREIHDSNLAEIAKNPETAAFAHAALMRMPSGGQESGTDTEDVIPGHDDDGDDVFELEEEVDDHSIATTVQKHLVRGRSRIDSDAESDAEDAQRSSGGWHLASRVAGDKGSQPSMVDDLTSDGLDGDAFSTVAIEKLIVRRKTLRTADSGAASKTGAAWRPPPAQKSLLKRTGVAMVANNAKRLNSGGN